MKKNWEDLEKVRGWLEKQPPLPSLTLREGRGGERERLLVAGKKKKSENSEAN